MIHSVRWKQLLENPMTSNPTSISYKERDEGIRFVKLLCKIGNWISWRLHIRAKASLFQSPIYHPESYLRNQGSALRTFKAKNIEEYCTRKGSWPTKPITSGADFLGLSMCPHFCDSELGLTKKVT